MTHSVLDPRFERFGSTMRRQLDRLYGADHDVDALWTRAEAILRQRHNDRSPDLRLLDDERARDPNWFVQSDMIGYSTYVDRFGGTIAGVANHVAHLEALGVRYLHLLALLKAREGDSDGGFAVSDYLAIEPALGGMDDLEALAARLREGRISLCVDLALNHTADDHAWALAAKAGDPFYRDFYIVLDEADAHRREAELQQVFPTTAPGNFTYVAAMNGWVWTTFYPFQWDLNWANPELFLAMLDTMLRLANRGFEAFRFDSTAFLWKAAGTNCRNLPPAHWIVRALRAALDIAAPATLLKAEAIVPTALVPPYFGFDDGDGFEAECHLVYNNSLMVAGWVGLAEGSAELPSAIVQASGGLPAGANWLTYARCHDDIGWANVLKDLAGLDDRPLDRLRRAASILHGDAGGWARGEPFQADGGALHGTNGTLASLAGLEAAEDERTREMACRRIALLHALAVASGGLATIYMGDEAGLLNDRGYLADPEKAHEGRWLHRPAMDWAAFGNETALRISSDLARLRAARIASGGVGASTSFHTGDDRLLGIVCGEDRVMLNFSGEPVASSVRSLDRLSNAAFSGTVEPWSVVWLEQGA